MSTMRIDLGLRQHLTMVMTPQLQMAIKLLQMARADLVEAVQEELKENPLLEDADDTETEHSRDEVVDPIETAGETELPLQPLIAKEQTDAEKEVPVDTQPATEIDQSFLENLATGPSLPAGERPDSDDLPSTEQTLRKERTLEEHLSEQLRLAQLPEEESRCAELIIGNLDADGYFKEPSVEDLAAECEVSVQVVERALSRVQRFDPVGCAARTLSECLLAQAEMLGLDDDLMVCVLKEHLGELSGSNLPRLAKKLKVELDELRLLAQEISRLDPRPGRRYCADLPQYITPDVHIVKVGDTYFVNTNDDGLPKLRISRYYQDLLRKESSKAARDYVQERLRSARWLIDSILQRQRTIVKVAESILKFQRDFFEKGPGHLKPLILRDVANDIGMHESTISRATANKYVHTPQGLFELKYFFNSAINREGGQDDIASESVKGFIKQIVHAENAKKPLSDQKIVELLKQRHGVEIARRTVAKYREQLGILDSSKRKKTF